MIRWNRQGNASTYCEADYQEGLKTFAQSLGGVKAFILNHAKKGENKYNIVHTDGKTFKTNDREQFFEYLRGII